MRGLEHSHPTMSSLSAVATTKHLVNLKPRPISKILSFDLEWSLDKDKFGEHRILAAGFCDSDGKEQAILIEDYLGASDFQQAERTLLSKIVQAINKYDWSVGFYSTGRRGFYPTKQRIIGRDSDLIQLHRRLVRHGMYSPIRINDISGIPYLVGRNNMHTHLDAYNILSNKVIKSSIYKGAYASNDLDTISQSILGEIEGGKHQGLSGQIFESITNLEEKRAYVLQDAKLVMKIIAHDNYALLKTIHSLATLTNTSFRNICNSKGVTKIWTPILDDRVTDELRSVGQNIESVRTDPQLAEYCNILIKYLDSKKNELLLDSEDQSTIYKDSDYTDNKPRYIGALVLDPIPGEYNDVNIFDFTSLYPSIIILCNISFETVNCHCCKDNPLAQLPSQIMEKGKRWYICLKRSGILTKQITEYTVKRIDYKQRAKLEFASGSLNKAHEYERISGAYKILINSAYGQLGFRFSKYENVKAAELVTLMGRYILGQAIKISTDLFGWNVIYGDTDSIFCNNKITEQDRELFKDTCKLQLNVDIDLDKIYDRLVITGKKNYFGITKDKLSLDIKGLSGKKSDRCLWVRNAFKQMLIDYKNGINPCVNLTAELDKLRLSKLKDAEHQLLMIKTLSMNVEDYKVDTVQKLVGTDKNLESGDTARYYLSDKKSKRQDYTYDIKNISISKYEDQLINTIYPVLKVLGYCNTANELRAKLLPTYQQLINSSIDGGSCPISVTSVTSRNKRKKLIQI